MSKCVFFDADGTLIDFQRGVAPDVPAAIAKLRENGHYPILCTGRPRCLIPAELEALPLSGIISNLGAYMEYEGKPVYQVRADPKVARRAVDIIRQGGMVPVMEGDDCMYFDTDQYTAAIDSFAPYIAQLLGDRRLPLTGNEDRLSINKVSAKRMPGCREDWVCRELAEDFDAVRYEAVGVSGRTVEMVLRGHSKGKALLQMAAYLGVDARDTLAFGDSQNDLTMLEAAHIGVAMGDGSPILQKQADYVTAPLFEEGISKGLKHFGLL